MEELYYKVLQCLKTFLVFNQNSLYYILYFIKNFWVYLFVVASIFLMFYYEIKALDDKFVDDNRRII